MHESKHPFEKAGLGQAPFKLIRFEKKSGSRCDLCSQPLKNVFWIRGADGSQFRVGSNCVMKTPDYNLKNAIENKIKEVKRESEISRINACEEMLNNAEVRTRLESQPAPDPWRQQQGDSALDWCDWMIRNSGKTGKLKVAKFIEQFDFK